LGLVKVSSEYWYDILFEISKLGAITHQGKKERGENRGDQARGEKSLISPVGVLLDWALIN
jgi:hypothetical protein